MFELETSKDINELRDDFEIIFNNLIDNLSDF